MKQDAVSLPALGEGQSGEVVSVGGAVSFAGRLADLGLYPGVRVTLLRRAPFGDPAAYRFGDVSAAVRNRDAAGVRVLPDDGRTREESTEKRVNENGCGCGAEEER